MEQSLVLTFLVLAAAIVWVGFVFVMLNGLDRARTKARKEGRQDTEEVQPAPRKQRRRSGSTQRG